jgi:recombination protein RecR
LCGNYTDKDSCAICVDPHRCDRQLCVVTSTADLIALEGAGTYRGRYHVLQGVLAPLDGIGPDDLRLEELLSRLRAGDCEELILATPLSVEGEATATYVAELAGAYVQRVTRIASGVPHGGELELSDPVTLGRALAGRRSLD